MQRQPLNDHTSLPPADVRSSEQLVGGNEDTSACQEEAMRPSISVTLEPGLERGVPWGRDLYTFVTSAAGHMMRTLQKPRKNRPSKRQVNHRRFLHNMIQRKFADIEAANHRLASALYYKDEEKNVSSPPSEKPKTLDQTGSPSQGDDLEEDPDKPNVHTDVDSIPKARSDISAGSNETKISEKKQQEVGHLWKRHPTSQPTIWMVKKNNQSTERQKRESRNQQTGGLDHDDTAELLHTESHDSENQLKSANKLSEDSGFNQFGQNVDVSPFSPFSLDSCDFSIQMFTDASTSTQKSIADISDSQWMDIMDLFSSKDLGGCGDVEAYFESIYACEGDAGQEVGADEVAFTGQWDSSRSEVEDLHYDIGGYRYEYSCHADQGSTINQFNSDQMSTQTPGQNEEETQLISYPCHASELQYQEQSACMMVNCENDQNFAPFEGVAQSFSVPLHNSEQRLVLTPTHEHDWLFTDILKDTRSPDYQEHVFFTH